MVEAPVIRDGDDDDEGRRDDGDDIFVALSAASCA